VKQQHVARSRRNRREHSLNNRTNTVKLCLASDELSVFLKGRESAQSVGKSLLNLNRCCRQSVDSLLQLAAAKCSDVHENALNAAVCDDQLCALVPLLCLQREVFAKFEQHLWIRCSCSFCVRPEDAHGVAKRDHAVAQRVVNASADVWKHVLQNTPSISGQRGHSSTSHLVMKGIKYAAKNIQIRSRKHKKMMARTHELKSAGDAGCLHDSAFATAKSRDGFFSSQATASSLEHVATLGTNFTTFSSFITRPRTALRLLSMTIVQAEGHLSGTVRHKRCRMRATPSVRTAA
jgi:hypothetical protein